MSELITLEITETPIEITLEEEIIEIEIEGATGPRGVAGPQGPPGGTPTITAIAARNVGGHRAVYLDDDGEVEYADKTVATAYRVIGITASAANIGEVATVQTGGLMTEGSWSWVPGAIYVDETGTLTQTPPSEGGDQSIEIATAITSTQILIRIRPGIELI